MMIAAMTLAAMAEAARADAAQRAGLPPAQVQIVSAESVTWPDGSLGCPKPGLLYTQALVPGFLIRVKAGMEIWRYHASEQGKPVFCPPASAQQPLPDSRK